MGLCLLMALATRGQQGPPLVASLGQNFGELGGGLPLGGSISQDPRQPGDPTAF